MQPFLGCIGDRVGRRGGAQLGRAGRVRRQHGCPRGSAGLRPCICQSTSPGALLYIGDSHAAQGDSEVAGTGNRSAAACPASGRSDQGKKIAWPRFENDTSTQRRRRLPVPGRCASDCVYGAGRLDPHRLRPVGPRRLRAAVESRRRIHLTEMVDPNYVVVATVDKRFLPGR